MRLDGGRVLTWILPAGWDEGCLFIFYWFLGGMQLLVKSLRSLH